MGGTGLGLAIVKHIVAHHRGHLKIASVKAGDTTFAIHLPLAETNGSAARRTEQAS
jgi:signal transduction histidine kinase